MGKQYRVKCHKTDHTGKGLVTFNQSVFAISGLLDGEYAKIELVYGKDRKSTTARLAELETSSPDRQQPFCKAYSRCGGCNLQHATYQKQLSIKKNAAECLLSKFAPVPDVIGMESPFHYRHKVHATFYRARRGIELGIYEENTHHVIPVTDCAIQNTAANAILRTIRALADSFHLPAYNEDTMQGLLRHVLIRCAAANSQVMVILVVGNSVFPRRSQFIHALKKEHPEITTIIQNINSRKTSMVLGDKETILFGNGYIEDSLCGLTFRISSKSFYQINPAQTEILYQTALDFAGLTGQETVLDAYCGTGTIGLIASAHCKKVIGVENNAAAVKDAISNAQMNHIQNAEFIHADAGEYLTRLASAPDLVFMDPPRSGAGKQFLKALMAISPRKIVYISCSLESLAEDLQYMAKHGYQAERIQPVDLFPWTGHVECVVLMSRVEGK